MPKDTLALDHHQWLLDLELRSCSLTERGALIDLMCMAKDGRPEGFLTVSGRAITDVEIASQLRCTPDEWQQMKKILLERKRITALASGTLYIPRMVKDGQIREAAQQGGLFGGNPDLVETPVERSAPVSPAYYYNKLPNHLRTPKMKEAIGEWFEYRQRARLILTRDAVTRQVNILAALSDQEAVRWIVCAIDKNWRGFYPPPAGWSQTPTLADPAVQEYVRQLADLIMHKAGQGTGRIMQKIQDIYGKEGMVAVQKLADKEVAKRREIKA